MPAEKASISMGLGPGVVMAALSFQELQARLSADVEDVSSGSHPWDVLVVPSLNLDAKQIALVTGAHHYEERQLFELIRLRQPRARMVFVTSKLLPELVVDAVLELLPGVPISHARQRLKLFDTDDASPRPLAAKLLERPRLLQRIRDSLHPDRSFISCFNVGQLEHDLSEALQLPLLGSDPALSYWGSKAGSRELFQRCGLNHPDGSELVHSFHDLVEAAVALVQRNPQLQRLVVKLNEGFSGEGNAPLDLQALKLEQNSAFEQFQKLEQALAQLAMPAADWQELLKAQGGLVEAWLSGGEELRSPSVQGKIHPGGQVEVLSTHEQHLGGPTGQTYLGCQFPAHQAYRLELQRWGHAVGQQLAQLGALDHFSVDGLARRFGEQWDLQAIEVNLRKGGTTHPMQALRYLSNGALDQQTGEFLSPQGSALHYRATDNFTDTRLQGLLPMDLIDLVAGAGMHYDPVSESGSVFHLLGCLSEHGKLGMTCIGRSAEQAEQVFQRTQARLLQQS